MTGNNLYPVTYNLFPSAFPIPLSVDFCIVNISFRGDFVKNAHIKVKIEDRIISCFIQVVLDS